MARTKQTPKKSDAKTGEMPKKIRQPSKWGTGAEGVWHLPGSLPAGPDGKPSYIGMHACNCRKCTAVGDVEDALYKCNALNGTNVVEVEDTLYTPYIVH